MTGFAQTLQVFPNQAAFRPFRNRNLVIHFRGWLYDSFFQTQFAKRIGGQFQLSQFLPGCVVAALG